MNIVLIDDEPLAMDLLERRLKELYEEACVHKFIHFDYNKNSHILYETDVIFLDIEMPGTNGLELAEKILDINSELAIVFVTAYQAYAVQAFELNALDYLLKPVEKDRLKKTLDRITSKRYDRSAASYPNNHDKKLSISVCGELSFQYSNEEKEVISWRTAKAQELFLYLLHYCGKSIHKAELIELLWPDYEPEKAYTQLYTAIYHIRRALRHYRKHLNIKNVQSGYTLQIEEAQIDIRSWESKLESAPKLELSTIELYEEIMEEYTGSYLEVNDYIWAEQERFRLSQLWAKTANQIAACYEKKPDLEKAIEWYVKICEKHPEEEQSAFQLMKIYAEVDYGVLVHYQYKRLKKALADLGLEVNNQITSWYENWEIGNMPKV